MNTTEVKETLRSVLDLPIYWGARRETMPNWELETQLGKWAVCVAEYSYAGVYFGVQVAIYETYLARYEMNLMLTNLDGKRMRLTCEPLKNLDLMTIATALFASVNNLEPQFDGFIEEIKNEK